jgi:hypothetical protein
MVNELESVARQVTSSTFHNTFNIPTVDLFFQRSPGNGNSNRGIDGLQFQVESRGSVIQKGITRQDGQIVMLVPGGAAQLQLLHKGVIVARYNVIIQTIGLDPVERKAGQHQRLRMLGYQIGHGGPLKDGVTGDDTPLNEVTDKEDGEKFERSILDFQVDIGSLPGNSTILQPLKNETGV